MNNKKMRKRRKARKQRKRRNKKRKESNPRGFFLCGGFKGKN